MRNSTSKKMFLFILLTVSYWVANAQITITYDDFFPQMQLGEKVNSYLDRNTIQVNIGNEGSTSWDFSNLVADNEFITESKTFSSSPYAADFSGAQYASNYSGTFLGTFSNTWVYSSLNANFITHGTGTVANTAAGNTTTIIKYSPAWVQFTLPVQYGDNHTYAGTQTVKTIVTIPGIGEFPTTIAQNVTIDQIVDAYGIVIMPGGKRLNGLRVKETSTFNNNGTITTSVVFKILTKTGESISIAPNDKNATSGLVTVADGGLSWNSGRGESLPDNIINAPSNLKANKATNGIELTWTDNSNNETGFNIERVESNLKSFTLLASVGANTSSYLDQTAIPGVSYTYRIQAFNNQNSSEHSIETEGMITVPIKVNAPTGLTASAADNSILLNWTDNADNETEFTIERKTEGGQFATIATLGSDATSHTDNNVETGVNYTYRVKANSEEIDSEYSNTVTALIEKTVITVNAPTGLTASAADNSILLNWADNADNETEYTVERKTEGGQFATIATLGSDETSHSDNNVETGVNYTYRVKASSEEIDSEYSNTVTALIEETVVTVNAPTDLTASAAGNSILLNWADNADNETEYAVERKTEGGQFAIIATLGSDATSHSDNNVETGVNYTYRVKAQSDETISEYSNTVIAIIEETVLTVNAPTGLTASAADNSILLNWTDNADNETEYTVERKTEGGQFVAIAALDSDATSHTDNNVETGVTYAYRVKANSEEIDSEYSNTASATMEETTGVFSPLDFYSQSHNYPNPFSNNTNICFELFKNEFVLVKVLNIEGKVIEILRSETLAIGQHEVNFDGSHLNNGVYFYSIQTGSLNQTKKMIKR